jgi:tRNA-specific 2-thiouridylase
LETIVVGVTGRIDSAVAAYLLKKQGFRVIALGIELHDGHSEDEKDIFAPYMSENLERVKTLCEELEITFYGVNAMEEFKAHVLDEIVGARLGGKSYSPEIAITNVVVKTLISKADKLGAKKVATGHYGRIIKQHGSTDYAVGVGIEQAYDQSYCLSCLGNSELARLTLPLSELRQQEVDRIGNIIGVKRKISTREFSLMEDNRLGKEIEQYSCASMMADGMIYTQVDEMTITDHFGVHHHYVGETKLVGKGTVPVDAGLSVVRIDTVNGNLYVHPHQELTHQHCVLSNCNFKATTDMSVPLKVFARLKSGGEFIPCAVFFKNNQTILLDFLEEKEGVLPAGISIALYTDNGKRARVICCGVVAKAGILGEYKLEVFPNKEDEELFMDDDDAKKKVKKFNYVF